jgi:hypothetical protein
LVYPTSRPAIFDGYILTFDIANFSQPLTERCRKMCKRVGRPAIDEPDHRHSGLLRMRMGTDDTSDQR